MMKSSQSKRSLNMLFVMGATSATLALTTTSVMAAAEPAARAADAPAASTEPKKKQIVALVAALGDQFTYVRQQRRTGSNIIDNNTRRVIKTADNGLNVAVLKGLDRAVGAAHPGSERVYISLNPAEMSGVRPQEREEVAIGKIIAQLDKMPQRMEWYKIVVATPKYLQSEYSGMGPKLEGFGVYFQPLKSDSLDGLGGLDALDEIVYQDNGESGTVAPDGTPSRSKVYVAPYSYIQIYVIDAKTLKVLEKNARHDFTKLYDPQSTANDVQKSIPPEVLVAQIGKLIERSVQRAVSQTEFGVTVQVEEVGATAETAKPSPSK